MELLYMILEAEGVPLTQGDRNSTRLKYSH